MSTSKTYQQSLANVGYENRPPMLERGSYIPWASRSRRYLNRKRDNRKWLLKALDEGPYEFKNFVPEGSTIPRLQTAEDLEVDDLLLHDAEMEVMNMILLSIPNEIYNSVDACTSAKDMWKRVERLMRGTIQNKVDRETRFTNEFDQFVAEPGEALVSVYNRFAQLMNDLERNNMNFPTVTINTKFLNSLQPEWLKYKLVNASRAKKLEKSHDPLALVANTGSSSRQTSSYYVTHPTSVVDYDDEYQQDDVHNNSEDPLVFAMLLLAKDITQNFSNPTNNRLHASSNTRNQAIIQGDRVNIQSRNSGNTRRNGRRAYVQEEVVEGMNAPKETGNVQRTLRIPSSGNTSTIQCYNYSEKGHYARNCPKPRVRDSKYFMEQILLAKQDEAGCSVEKAPHFPDLCAVEKLARNAYQEAEKQRLFAQQVQTQNTHLTSQLEMYKERVRILENINKDNNYLNEFLEADERAKRYNKQASTQLGFVVAISFESRKTEINSITVKNLQQKNEELQKTHSILKRQMSEKEDTYHDTILDLEAKLKKNVDLILKLGNSLQGMFMLGPKPLSVYDQQLKHGLGYPNPYTLKQAISKCPKLYVASSLGNLEIPLNVRDSEDTLEDAFKNFVPQKELSVEQKYFSSSSIPSVKIPVSKNMPSESPLIKELDKIKVCFEKLSLLIQQNCKRASIFYTSPAEIQINDFCQDQVKPILNELKVYLEFFRNLFQMDIKEMKDVFESTESELDELEKQNDLLKDKLLEASLKHDVELCSRIKILGNDVKRFKIQSVDFELKLQHEKEKHKWDSTSRNKNTNPLDYSWISKLEKLENENVSLDFKDFLSTISELKTRLEKVEKGVNATSRVRRPMSKDSSVTNSVLVNSKKAAKNVSVYVRKNKQKDNTSANVISNKENVILLSR
ncbi:retrovirus-related pol polyprotein from transposon TNT 1-94 [Tanacetum coccineum]